MTRERCVWLVVAGKESSRRKKVDAYEKCWLGLLIIVSPLGMQKKTSFLQLMKQTNQVAVTFILLTVLVRYLGLKHCFSPKVFFGHFCL